MKTKGIALLSAAALLAPGLALAGENLPWTYLEAGYIPKIGSDDLNIDAGQITGSIGFLGMGHAQVEYTNGSSDGFNVGSGDSDGDGRDRDFDGYRLVVGGHNQLGENTQLIGDLTYFDYSYDGGEGFGGADLDGLGIGVGLRHALNSRAEVSAQLWYLDGEVDPDFGSKQDFNSTILEIKGRYNWTKQLSTGLTAYLGGTFFAPEVDSNLIRADIRWAFGNSDFSDLK
jgi:hypothetical protein